MATPQGAALPIILDLTVKGGKRVFNPATDTLGAGDNIKQSVASGAITIGSPVYPDSDGTVAMGQANASNPSCIVGIACNAAADAAPVGFVTTGPLELTTVQWDAVIDGVATGGLTPGEVYYLSDANAGGLIPSADAAASGLANPDNLVVVGRAVTSTCMIVDVIDPLPL